MSHYLYLNDNIDVFNPGGALPVVLRGYSTPCDDDTIRAQVLGIAAIQGVHLIDSPAPIGPLLPATSPPAADALASLYSLILSLVGSTGGGAGLDTLKPETFGGIGDGVHDDTAALNAAASAAEGEGGGFVSLDPGKIWYITDPFVIGEHVGLPGSGGNRGGTIIRCGSATACVQFGRWAGGRNHPTILRDVHIDANGTGDPRGRLQVQAVQAGIFNTHLADSQLVTTLLADCVPGNGIMFDTAQNMRVLGLDADGFGGAALRMDNGAGGNAFYGCGLGSSNQSVLITDNAAESNGAGYPTGPANNYWRDCVFETRLDAGDAIIRAEAGAFNLFDYCSPSVDAATTVLAEGALVAITNPIFTTLQTILGWRAGTMYGGNTTARHNGFHVWGSNELHLSDADNFFGQLLNYLIYAASGTPVVKLLGDPFLFNVTGGLFGKAGGAALFNVYNTERILKVFRIADPTTYPIFLEMFRAAEAQPRVTLDTAGSVSLGDGTAVPAAGVIYDSARGGALATKGKPFRFGATGVQKTSTAVLPGTAASYTIDASITHLFEVAFASGTSSVASLAITNPQEASELTISFYQSSAGGSTYAWPTNCTFKGLAPDDTTPNTITTVHFHYNASGTRWVEQWRSVRASAVTGTVLGPVDTDRGRLPYYADTLPLLNRFEQRSSVYNNRQETLHAYRAKLKKVSPGVADCHHVWFGHSLNIGWDGTAYHYDNCIPRSMGRALAASLGVGFGGGIQFAAGDTAGRVADNVTLTGSFTNPGLFLSSNGVGTITVVLKDQGTVVEWACSDLTTATVNWKIDGVAQAAVTLTNTNTIRKVQKTGLAAGAHTLEIDSAAGQVLVVTGWRCYDPSVKKLYVHNLAFGGARAAGGVNNGNYSSQSNVSTYGLGWIVDQTIAAFGITADTVAIYLGGNDIASGGTPAATIAGIAARRAIYATAPLILLHSWMIPGTTQATWDSFAGMMYSEADTLGVPLFDHDNWVGRQATAQADGLLGIDNTHPLQGEQIGAGQHLASVFGM